MKSLWFMNSKFIRSNIKMDMLNYLLKHRRNKQGLITRFIMYSNNNTLNGKQTWCKVSCKNISEEARAAAAWQMGYRGGYLREWRTQLCTNQKLNHKIDYKVHCAGYCLILDKNCSLTTHFIHNSQKDSLQHAIGWYILGLKCILVFA